MKKPKSIRLTLNAAALELGVSPKTLSQETKGKGILPGEDGCFSVLQCVEAIYDDENRERVRLLKAQADAKELANKTANGEVVEIVPLAERMNVPLKAMLNVVLSSGLSTEAKDDLITQLRELFASIFDYKIKHRGALAALQKANPIDEIKRTKAPRQGESETGQASQESC